MAMATTLDTVDTTAIPMVSAVDTTTARGLLMLMLSMATTDTPMPMDMVLATTDMPTTDMDMPPMPIPMPTLDTMARGLLMLRLPPLLGLMLMLTTATTATPAP